MIERIAPDKFRAAIGFYPSCLGFKGDMTVPTLILIGELDDWTPAVECRNMVDGRDDWGISRQKDRGVPIKLIVYPDAYHAFDARGLTTPIQFFGHHLEFNPSATDQAISAVREFLKAQVGGN
jgi:dienelactone hydrolase